MENYPSLKIVVQQIDGTLVIVKSSCSQKELLAVCWPSVWWLLQFVSWLLVVCRPTVGWLLAVCWLTVVHLLAVCQVPVRLLLAICQLSVGCLLTDCWQAVSWMFIVCWPTVGCLSVDCWPPVGCLLRDSWLTVGYLLAVCGPTVSHLSAHRQPITDTLDLNIEHWKIRYVDIVHIKVPVARWKWRVTNIYYIAKTLTDALHWKRNIRIRIHCRYKVLQFSVVLKAI